MNFRVLRAVAAVALTAGLASMAIVHAQDSRGRDPYDRYDKNGRYDAYSPLAELAPGALIPVRTGQAIDTDRRDGRVYPAVVDQDVWDDARRLAVPMIRRGSPAELLVRAARDGDLILDLDSVTVNGQRYAVTASRERIDNPGGAPSSNTPAYVGGGALLGTIVGAIAGGGKGAAIGAIAGAAGGAALSTQGRRIVVPQGSVLTFSLDERLSVGVPDTGYKEGGVHYHR